LQTARTELAAAIAAEKEAATAMSVEPRVLANGAPACGNTGGKKMSPCTTERSDAEWKARVQRLVQAGVAVRASQARVAALTEIPTADVVGINAEPRRRTP
jgi:hypothetical protein